MDSGYKPALSELKVYNLQLLTLLDEKEAFSIAKSIAKWTYSKFTKSSFDNYVIRIHSSDIQSIRGALGGKKSKGGGRKRNEFSDRSIKPWVYLNISRSTYYRMKNEGKV